MIAWHRRFGTYTLYSKPDGFSALIGKPIAFVVHDGPELLGAGHCGCMGHPDHEPRQPAGWQLSRQPIDGRPQDGQKVEAALKGPVTSLRTLQAPGCLNLPRLWVPVHAGPYACTYPKDPWRLEVYRHEVYRHLSGRAASLFWMTSPDLRRYPN